MGDKTKRPRKQHNPSKSGKKRRRPITVIVIIVLILLLILLLRQCGYFRFPWETPPAPIVAGDLFPDVVDAVDGHLSGMTEEEILAQMQRIADESQFSFKINAKPEFLNGWSAGTLRIENPNYNVYPMVVQIVLDDTGEIIYDSGGILPDQHIDTARLTRVLRRGTHKATAHLYAYDPDTKVCQGESNVKLEITVKN
ncbi:MAG: hypothetical protein ACOX88_02605 [Christensenellales bacterium]|jgi:hypothetical protein